ncbi:PREDICTED: 31 kDa ribonucleoprotein, chloroplastic [Nelumbo nucifera]|uniref:RRM domain-containing protein n=2 Tax=Nelumbo nucifera TaxID=4432 RepID=A0A822XJ70_NELNU|nr:PREDICTED: 31 kDa ribonucleoprotein, chloroplastic [Nelumbo nucifera]DAD20052.1 TPA_asm: hypothetical protein HUJ06_021515 [Nelumbo nucifera]
MAAAAAATVGSCFSTATAATSCIRSKYASSDFALKISLTRTLQVAPISHSLTTDSLSIGAISQSQKWRISRISASVAQEEAAAAIQTAPETVEEEGDEKGEEQVEQVSTEGEATDPVNTKLYFGNLPYSCDSAQLAGIIQQYGSPEMVEVLYNRDTGKSRGFGFVTMSNIEDANRVIENLDGSEYCGRTLRVNFSDKPRPRESLYPESEYKLFVGNLSWSVTSESLTKVFQEYGNVVGARVLYDGETGRSRGYGFVCYSSEPEMEAALEHLNGVELEGRTMRISLAQGKRS